MATNPFFADQYYAFTEDQALYQDLIDESIQAKGIDMHYLPRTLTNFDELFGEDGLSAFNQAIVLEFFVENVQGWEGQGSFLSKFGLEIRDEATLTVSKRRFQEEVTSRNPDMINPREGDLIVIPSPVDKRVRAFEITYVETNDPFMQLGKQYVYKLKVKNFEMNGESFETGVESIDEYDVKNSLAIAIELASGAGTYTVGETVYQGTVGSETWSGIVVSHINDTLTVYGTSSDPDYVADIIGADSGAIWNPTDKVSGTANTFADNDVFENSDVIVNDEHNPFTS